MKLIRQFSFTETKRLQLYELNTIEGHKGYWLILTEATIPEKPISQTLYYSENEAVDAYLRALEAR